MPTGTRRKPDPPDAGFARGARAALVRGLGGGLYGLTWGAALALGSPYLLYRALQHRDEMRERCGGGGAMAPGGVWLHTASLGEMRGALPLLGALRARGVDTRLSVMTPTARLLAGEALAAGAAAVRYLPLDFQPFVMRSLTRERPRALLVCETEIWPALVAEIVRRRIPLAFVSARMTRRGWRRMRWLRPWLRTLLGPVGVAAQSAVDAARWIDLGVPPGRVAVTGNTKYERPRGPLDGAERGARRAGWRRVIAFGSVRSGEIAAVKRALEALAGRGMPLLAIVAPRHVERADNVARALEGAAGRIITRGERTEVLLPPIREAAQGKPTVLLVRTTGELRGFYAVSDLAFVGGSLTPIGGHSLFEAAELGVPVLYGPHTANVAEVVEALKSAGGGRQVADGGELGNCAALLLADPPALAAMAKGAYLAADRLGGAVTRTLAALDRWGFPLDGGEA